LYIKDTKNKLTIHNCSSSCATKSSALASATELR
jgi:hypothetical protein